MTKPQTPECQCGCFAPTKGGSYLPGHDARHVSVLASYVQAGTHTPDQALGIFRDSRPALHNKLVQRLTKMDWIYDPTTRVWSRQAEPAAAEHTPAPRKGAAPRKIAAAAFEIQITEVGPRTFGYYGQNKGTLVRLSGHPHIEGHEIARLGDTYREPCAACAGTGNRPGYGHVDSGRCWPCQATGLGALVGTGTALELARRLRDRAQAADRRQAKRDEKDAKAKAAHTEWLAANPEIAGIAARFGGNFTNCEHELAPDAIAQYRECYREECDERVREIRNTHDPLLLELAGYASCRVISDKQAALLPKLVADHAVRAAAREAKIAANAEKVWLGAEKEKITVTGTLGKPIHFDGDYGSSTLYKITTAEGDVVSWFRTGYHTPEEGATITLTGTVKALKDSEKYGKETQLTRCKIS